MNVVLRTVLAAMFCLAAVSMRAADPSCAGVMKVDVKPSFQGGDSRNFAEWVCRNVSYPSGACRSGVKGRVLIRFIVNKKGYVKNVEVVDGVESSLDAEAVRVVASSPRWTPGKVNGKSVDVIYYFPVVFKPEL